METLKQWVENLPTFLQDKQEHKTIIVHETTEIGVGWEEDFNKDYCIEHNIPYYLQNRNGGTIVCSKGNIGIGFIYSNKKYHKFMLEQLILDLVEYLKTKELNVELNNNDVMVDGFKVASSAGYNLEPDYNWTYEVVQISINQDLETIKNVCLKPMVKIPNALSDYDITTQEIVDFVNNWFKVNTYEN